MEEGSNGKGIFYKAKYKAKSLLRKWFPTRKLKSSRPVSLLRWIEEQENKRKRKGSNNWKKGYATRRLRSKD